MTVNGAADEFYYYRRDHLGNNREVWKAENGTATTVQRTRYYLSGQPWEYQAGDSASLQLYMYDYPTLRTHQLTHSTETTSEAGEDTEANKIGIINAF